MPFLYTKIMLIQVPIKFQVFQVVEGRKHPESSLYGYMSCPICFTHLHGHGWRQRYMHVGGRQFSFIWVHRKLCPKCRRTYTLVPKDMSSVFPYALVEVCEALLSRMAKGHFTSKLDVPRETQKRWWQNFMQRLRAAGGMFPGREEMEGAARDLHPFSVLGACCLAFRNPAELRAIEGWRARSHHQLRLVMSLGMP